MKYFSRILNILIILLILIPGCTNRFSYQLYSETLNCLVLCPFGSPVKVVGAVKSNSLVDPPKRVKRHRNISIRTLKFFGERKEERKKPKERMLPGKRAVDRELQTFSQTIGSRALLLPHYSLEKLLSDLGLYLFVCFLYIAQSFKVLLTGLRAADLSHIKVFQRVMGRGDKISSVFFNISRKSTCYIIDYPHGFHSKKICMSASTTQGNDAGLPKWLFRFHVDPPPTKVTVQINISHTFQRLASFQQLPLAFLSEDVRTTVLAHAGFAYTGYENIVKCEGCERSHPIASIMSNPNAPNFHGEGCSFAEIVQEDDSLNVEHFAAQSTKLRFETSLTSQKTSPYSNSFETEEMTDSGPSKTNHEKNVLVDEGRETDSKTFSCFTLQKDETIFHSMYCDGSSKESCDDVQEICKTPAVLNSEDLEAPEFIVKNLTGPEFDSGPIGGSFPDVTETPEMSLTDSSPSPFNVIESRSDSGFCSDEEILQGKPTTLTWGDDESTADSAERNLMVHQNCDEVDAPSHRCGLFRDVAVSQNQHPLSSQTLTNTENRTELDNFDDKHLFCLEIKKKPKNFLAKLAPDKKNYNLENPEYPECFASNITAEKLPPYFRCQEMVEFVERLAVLVVRIVVRTSRDPGCFESVRAEQRPLSGSALLSIKKPCYKLYGTGSVILEFPGFETSLEPDTSTGTSKVELSQAQQDEENFPILVATSSHLIRSDEEAANTTVEFNFESVDQTDVVTLRGWKLHASNKELGDNTCLLLCRTSKQSLLQKLQWARNQMKSITRRFPEVVKRFLLNSVIVPSHLHRKGKAVSFGDKSTIFYNLRESLDGTTKILAPCSRYPDANSRPIRQALVYTAETCAGSTGAPVVSFRRTGVSCNGQIFIEMDLWVHQGIEQNLMLKGSSLKGFGPDQRHQNVSALSQAVQFHGRSPFLSDPETISTACQHSIHERKNGTTGPWPSAIDNPLYASLAKRLSSFSKWPSSCHFLPEVMARKGFYYAGYDDCIRCFCCGLGLKDFSPEDDIDLEHWNRSPDCISFDLTSFKRPTWESQAPKEAKESLKRMLVVKEHTLLLELYTCKSCKSAPSTDMFLPCQHLCVCVHCCIQSTHCPVCGTPSPVTLTTFFA